VTIRDLLFTRETTPEGGGDAGTGEPVAAAEPVAATEPAQAPAEPAAEGGEPAPAQAAEPAPWSADDPVFRSAVAEEAEAIVGARLAELFQQGGRGFDPAIAGATPGPIGGGEFDWTQVDPYSDEFGSQLGQGIEQTLQKALSGALSPMTSAIEQAQTAELEGRGEEIIKDIIAAEISAGDDLTDESKQILRSVFDPKLEEYAQRYGRATPREAEMAARDTVAFFRSIEKAAEQRALARHTNHTATLAGARGEPGTGVAGVSGLDTASAAAATLQGRTALSGKYGTRD
jgi:hypothetical protein